MNSLQAADVAVEEGGCLGQVAHLQSIDDMAMGKAGGGLPTGGAEDGKYDSGVRELQLIEHRDQSRHSAGGDQFLVKDSIGLLPFDHCSRTIPLQHRAFDLLERRGIQSGRGVRECEGFEGGANLHDLLRGDMIERGHLHSAARLADGQPLHSQELEGFADGHVTGFELFGDMILTERGVGRHFPRDDSLGEGAGDSFGGGFDHIQIIDYL